MRSVVLVKGGSCAGGAVLLLSPSSCHGGRWTVLLISWPWGRLRVQTSTLLLATRLMLQQKGNDGLVARRSAIYLRCWLALFCMAPPLARGQALYWGKLFVDEPSTRCVTWYGMVLPVSLLSARKTVTGNQRDCAFCPFIYWGAELI